MTKNKVNLLLCCVSLMLGGGIYLLFRENTYISQFVDGYVNMEKLRDSVRAFDSCFLRNHIPDFMWSFGLCCGLNVVASSVLVNGCIASLYGVSWEMLQYLGVVNGTGDVFDIITYLAACITAVMINKILFRRSENEEDQ